MINHLAVAYYPEHCDESRWPQDIALMREYGIDTVRILEFAWSRLEHADDVWSFDWLHRLMAQLLAAEIQVIPCTPSAAPPRWLTFLHEECLAMDRHGHRAAHGGRRHYCPTSRIYRDYCTRIAARMQEELGGYPNILGWHIDNEFGWNLCFCQECETAYRSMVERKYGTLERLNEAWGGAFWSIDYWDWNEVGLPRSHHNTPAIGLELRQFYSDTITSFMTEQVSALRQAGCKTPISTNMMGDFNEIDYWAMADPLDVVGWDNYFDIYTLAGDSMAHNLMRSLKGGKGYWTFENGVNSVTSELQTAPGFNIVHALSAMAHGEEVHTFFRWDSCPFGQEQDLQGLVDWAGKPRAKLREVKELRRILDEEVPRELPPLAPRVAMVYSWQNYWTTATYYKDYWHELEAYYQALFSFGVPCDFVAPDGDFSKYNLLLTPGLCLVSDAQLAALKSYVACGGVLLTGRKTLAKDPSANFRRCDHPALSDVFGMRVVETQGNEDWNDIYVRGFHDNKPERCFALRGHDDLPNTKSNGWFEVLELDSATPLFTYTEGYFPDCPAASQHSFGSGHALYLGTLIDPAAMRALLRHALMLAGITDLAEVPHGAQLVLRGELAIATNHSGESCTITLPGGELVNLPPYGYQFSRVERKV